MFCLIQDKAIINLAILINSLARVIINQLNNDSIFQVNCNYEPKTTIFFFYVTELEPNKNKKNKKQTYSYLG